jgi:hypothetical protein
MKRALLAALPAVLALGLVACGDDDDSPTTAAETTTPTEETEGSDATLPGGVTVPDLGSVLPGGSLPDFSIPDLSIPDLGSVLPGGSLPEFSIPDLGTLPTNAEEILASVFPNLNEDQLACLVDELGGELDPSRVPDLMETCDIAPGDLIPG